MSDQEHERFARAPEGTAEVEVEGHIVRGPETEKLIQRSDQSEDTPDVEGHLSLRVGPERFLDAEKPSV